jgi:nucleoside-diphosphate-sugar epimerase
MSRALIGHTGFVGSTLRRQASFDALYRSTDIDQVSGREFELLVCAGAPAEKWKANADPEADRANLDRLMRALDGVRAERALLVSTVDVYSTPRGVDEGSAIVAEDAQPYGRHRRLLERYFTDRFDAVIVRLPGLYGEGLKKNVIFDLLNDNMLDRINPRSVFQFYGLDRLWRDLEATLATGLRLVNFATEPVSVAAVARAGFDAELPDRPALPVVTYDVHTRYAGQLGGKGHYMQSGAQVLDGIARYVAGERERRRASAATPATS